MQNQTAAMPQNNTVNLPKKPTSVARVDFISDMANVINNSGLPAFIMEPIVKDMLLEIQSAAQKQYEHDKEQYEKTLASISAQASHEHV